VPNKLILFCLFSSNYILFSILNVLKTGYPLAATPLNAKKSFITASVLWIGSLQAIVQFNDFLLGLGMQIDESWKKYLKWLRQYACCRPGVMNDLNDLSIYTCKSFSKYFHESNNISP